MIFNYIVIRIQYHNLMVYKLFYEDVILSFVQLSNVLCFSHFIFLLCNVYFIWNMMEFQTSWLWIPSVYKLKKK